MNGEARAPLLTHEEIVRWFRRFRQDPCFKDGNGSFSVPIKPFCEYAGVARQHVYALLRDQFNLSPVYQRRLSQAIHDVQHGLRFARRKGVYEIVGPFSKLPRRAWTDARTPQARAT